MGQQLVRGEAGRTRGQSRSARTELVPPAPGNAAASRSAKAGRDGAN